MPVLQVKKLRARCVSYLPKTLQLKSAEVRIQPWNRLIPEAEIFTRPPRARVEGIPLLRNRASASAETPGELPQIK